MHMYEIYRDYLENFPKREKEQNLEFHNKTITQEEINNFINTLHFGREGKLYFPSVDSYIYGTQIISFVTTKVFFPMLGFSLITIIIFFIENCALYLLQVIRLTVSLILVRKLLEITTFFCNPNLPDQWLGKSVAKRREERIWKLILVIDSKI